MMKRMMKMTKKSKNGCVLTYKNENENESKSKKRNNLIVMERKRKIFG